MSAFNETHSSFAWKTEDKEAHPWDIQLIRILPSHLACQISNHAVVKNSKYSVKFVNFLLTPSMEYTALFLSLSSLDKYICLFFHLTLFPSLLSPSPAFIFNFLFLRFSLHDSLQQKAFLFIIFWCFEPNMSVLWNMNSENLSLDSIVGLKRVPFPLGRYFLILHN